MKIERPDKDGNGCSLDCGVSFVHTHPTGERKKPVPYKDTETTNQFIESQQELAREEIFGQWPYTAEFNKELMYPWIDTLITQIIKNTGEERDGQIVAYCNEQIANEIGGLGGKNSNKFVIETYEHVKEFIKDQSELDQTDLLNDNK